MKNKLLVEMEKYVVANTVGGRIDNLPVLRGATRILGSSVDVSYENSLDLEAMVEHFNLEGENQLMVDSCGDGVVDSATQEDLYLYVSAATGATFIYHTL